MLMSTNSRDQNHPKPLRQKITTAPHNNVPPADAKIRAPSGEAEMRSAVVVSPQAARAQHGRVSPRKPQATVSSGQSQQWPHQDAWLFLVPVPPNRGAPRVRRTVPGSRHQPEFLSSGKFSKKMGSVARDADGRFQVACRDAAMGNSSIIRRKVAFFRARRNKPARLATLACPGQLSLGNRAEASVAQQHGVSGEEFEVWVNAAILSCLSARGIN